ncbi:MAG: hypothetical protein AB8G22_29155 [Saprospiraceae bacterium]
MDSQAKLSKEKLQEVWEGIGVGLKPAIEDFDTTSLNDEEKQEVLDDLTELKKLALKIKNNVS